MEWFLKFHFQDKQKMKNKKSPWKIPSNSYIYVSTLINHFRTTHSFVIPFSNIFKLIIWYLILITFSGSYIFFLISNYFRIHILTTAVTECEPQKYPEGHFSRTFRAKSVQRNVQTQSSQSSALPRVRANFNLNKTTPFH